MVRLKVEELLNLRKVVLLRVGLMKLEVFLLILRAANTLFPRNLHAVE